MVEYNHPQQITINGHTFSVGDTITVKRSTTNKLARIDHFTVIEGHSPMIFVILLNKQGQIDGRQTGYGRPVKPVSVLPSEIIMKGGRE
jgi:hypothetical protein